jgi:hypothetical protein
MTELDANTEAAATTYRADIDAHKAENRDGSVRNTATAYAFPPTLFA